MKPISKKHFGNNYGSLAVSFHNGTSVVDGYVVRQIGTIRYEVSDGTTNKICELAQTDAPLTAGQMTIVIGGKTIRKLETFKATATDGEQINWKKGDVEMPVFLAPVYVEPVVELDQPVAPRFTKLEGETPRLISGTGNPVEHMVSSSNGEIEVAGAVRKQKKGDAFPAVDGVYSIELEYGKEWTYVYSVGLLAPLPGQAITDLYAFTAKIETNGSSLTFTLRRDAQGNYHFENTAKALDIVDDTQALGGSLYQGIQRVKFYAAHFGPDLPATEAGAVLGETTFTLTATPKNTASGAETVEVTFKAIITEAEPV